MGKSFDKISSVISDIETCELNRLNSLNALKINLLIGGVVIICTIFLVLGIYLVLIDKHLNLIWEILRIRARNSFFELKGNIDNRLAYIHGKEDLNEYDINSDFLKKKEALKFRHSLRTIARFSIIFIVAIFFILMQAFVLENNIQESLHYHPILTFDRMNRKILAARLTYYVFESRYDSDNSDSLDALYPYYNTITTPQSNLLSISTQLSGLVNKIRVIPIKPIFTSELQNCYYYSYSSNYSFLTTGTLNAIQYFIDESLNYGFNYANSIDTDIFIYYNESQALYNAMSVSIDLEDRDLNSWIISQLNNVYSFTVGFSILLALMYICYYYPMLTFEMKFLRKLVDIIQIMPKNSSSTMNKSVNQTRKSFCSILHSSLV